MCSVYTDLDAEMLIAAAALHDIGKIVELKTTMTGEADYTIDGRLFGHTLIGIQMIEKAAEELGVKCERIRLLEHCIAAHHGKAEYGAITVPATAEAQALNILDTLDAKMYQFEDAYRSVDCGMLSGKIFALDNTTVYRPCDEKELEKYFESGEQNAETDGGGTLYEA